MTYKRPIPIHLCARNDRIFWRHVKKLRDGCWMWTGAKQKKIPYGLMRMLDRKGYPRTVLAHRYSYRRFVGPIPKLSLVLHECDRGWCVRPADLYAGDHVANTNDAERRGRAAHPRGAANGHSKLTVAAVRLIRRTHSGHGALAQRLGVSIGAIDDVRGGRTWRYI